MSSSGRIGLSSIPLMRDSPAPGPSLLVSGVLTSAGLKAVSVCLEKGFAIWVDENHVLECGTSSKWFFESLMSTGSDRRIAQIFSKTAKGRQEFSIQDNATDLSLEAAKRFSKTSSLSSKDAELVNLKKEIAAARLGIDSSVFDANEGFQDFAVANHLHRCLFIHGHSLTVDPDTNKVSILQKGVLVPWDQVVLPKENGKWTGHYSVRGLEGNSRYDWSTLVPKMSGNPDDWGNQYAVKIIGWHAQTPSLTGEIAAEHKPTLSGVHTYFHMMTPEPENNIYSVGLYRPEKHAALDLSRPLRMRKARLQSPDESDAWGGRFETLTFAITKEQFESMKLKIEQDQANDNLTYHIGTKNCNEYTLEALKLAKVTMPSQLPIASLLPIPLPAVVINTLGALFGGSTVVDSDAASSTAHIGSMADLLDPSKAQLSHPHVLEMAFKKVEAWRSEQIAACEGDPEEQKRFKFALPAENLVFEAHFNLFFF
jgi:hypothetical protein